MMKNVRGIDYHEVPVKTSWLDATLSFSIIRSCRIKSAVLIGCEGYRSVKLFVVSHPCVLPINQEFFVEVERITGWSLSFVVPATWKSDYVEHIEPSRSESLSGQIHYIPVWNAGNIPLHLYKSWLVGLFMRERPNAIYVHHEPYALATAQVYLANRFATSCPIGFYAAQNIAKTYPQPIRGLETYVLSHSQFCFPVTEGALTVLRGKGYLNRGEVLPLAVNGKVYRPLRAEAKELRDRLHYAPNTFVIGYLGRLVEEKGLRSLIRALSAMADQPWVCAIVGTGPLETQLREDVFRAELAHRVDFIGYVPHEEAPKWLSAFDVLVLPSETNANWKEQFGRVLVEANACGTAVVGSTCGEIPAVIRSTGGGLIVPEGDPLALASALKELLQNRNKLEILAQQGHRAARSQYEQSHLASKLAHTIEAAIAEAR
jgi:glycosyltransferase involved in cell wall biosynthesis